MQGKSNGWKGANTGRIKSISKYLRGDGKIEISMRNQSDE